jgi:hypothetical protein
MMAGYTNKTTRRRPPRRRQVHKDAFRRLPLGSLRVLSPWPSTAFTRAPQLGVTVSAASMQVQALEQYLGLSLFRRRGQLMN